MKHTILVLQKGKKRIIKAKNKSNLLDILQKKGYKIPSFCEGVGSCGKCKIKILENKIKAKSTEKEILTDKEIIDGVRLACCHSITQGLKIEVPGSNDLEILTDGLEVALNYDPKIHLKNVEVEKASLSDQRDILTKIKDKYSEIRKIETNVIEKLPFLEENNLTLVLNEDKIIDVKTIVDNNMYGIAVDIGTTTLAFYLLDFLSKKEIAVYSIANSQQKYGADVISRINYTLKNQFGSKKMQQEIIKNLNQGINKLVEQSGIERKEIYQLVIAGNTVMMHFLLGVSAESIAKAPYISVFKEEIELKARELDINLNQNAFLTLLPSIASYVGADITSDLIVVNEDQSPSYLLIDIGTNGEIVLKNKDKIYACSAAAGPAFEGAKITHGRAGVAGAISAYSANGYQTIKNQKANGICGSGLLDIIAFLLENKYLNQNGALNIETLTTEQSKKIVNYKGQKAFLVVPADETEDNEKIVLTQKDIREFQLAKGAVAAGINLLFSEAGIKSKALNKIFIAGGFGNYINPKSALKVGLIPKVEKGNIIKIGNGAGLGAKIYLFDKNKKLESKKMIEKVKYIELSKSKKFQDYFMDSMLFKKQTR